jgi:hypothetical protein
MSRETLKRLIKRTLKDILLDETATAGQRIEAIKMLYDVDPKTIISKEKSNKTQPKAAKPKLL